MPLTDTAIRNAKLRTTPYKLYDGDGIYLLLKPSGSRLWRLKYHPDTFEAITREFLTLKSKSLNARTYALKTSRLESFIFPRVGCEAQVED